MPSADRPPLSRLTWVVLAVLLAVALGKGLRVTGCAGSCCAEAVAAVPQPIAAAEPRCCTAKACCATAPDGEEAPERHRSRCADGCCFALEFDYEPAPAPEAKPPASPAKAALAAPAAPRPSHPREGLVRRLPFDRGPPRVDRGTALRASTVLLI